MVVGIGINEKYKDLPYKNIVFPDDIQKLITRISNLKERGSDLNIGNTLGDLLDMDSEYFAGIEGIGILYARLLDRLKSNLSLMMPAIEQAYIDEEGNDDFNNVSGFYSLPFTVLSELNDYGKLIKRLRKLNSDSSRSFNIEETVGGVASLGVDEFSRVESVGLTYVHLLRNLKKEIPILASNYKEGVSYINYDELPDISYDLSKCFFNRSALSKEEIKLIQKLSNISSEIDVQQYLSLTSNELSGTVGFGKKYLDHFQELKTRVVTEIHDIHHGNFELDGMHKSVIVNSKYFDVNLNELDQILLDDVEEYLFSLSEVQQDVAQSRWGFHHEVETLEDIGRRSAVVRERIRQLSSVINKNVPHYIRIHPKVLGQNIRENLASNLAEVFPNLRDCFDSNYHFYSFLEILCMEESGAIHDIQEPDVDLNLLDLFFCDNSSPISYEVVVAELASNFGYSKALAANTIRELINKSKLKSDPEGLKPINLGRKEAVAHALLGYENGLPWKDIAKIVNRLEISNVCINEDRMQNSIFSDSDFIYQCDRGAYKNIKYFKIENVDVPHIIKSILDYIKVSNQKSIHLNDYYHQADGSIKAVNYYDIRHIARTFGSDYGLFFYGKSGVDSVGLTTDFEPVTQQKLILDLMNKAKAGLTNAEIANRLKSKSLAHAAFYLDKMMEAGEVVRVDNMIYTTPEKAFINKALQRN